MTKDRRGTVWIAAVVLLLTLPGAQAHGAPPLRDVDTRVLVDDDGLLAYGGCVEDQCQPAAPAEGLDLLALDLREAAFPDGGAAIVFRVIVQSEASAPAARLVIRFTAGGSEHVVEAATADGLAYTSATFDRIDGPFDVGDGHPKAIDGWLRHATLGVAAGDVLTGIRVESRRGETPDDAMPGGWYQDGVEVPRLPADPADVAQTPTAGEYTLKGAASLIAFSAEPAAPDLSKGPATVRLRLANVVGLPQFADLALDASAGVNARLGNAGVSLDPSGSRDIDLVVSNNTASGVVRVTLVSDLGAYESVNVTVQAPAIPTPSPSTGPASSTTAPGKDTPPMPTPLVVASLLAVALLLRRRVNP
ncbi:MAG: hypothetical protein WC876_05495 [Candidatus Thermoplasmatota archaeon]|jgi:hypothetical protein